MARRMTAVSTGKVSFMQRAMIASRVKQEITRQADIEDFRLVTGVNARTARRLFKLRDNGNGGVPLHKFYNFMRKNNGFYAKTRTEMQRRIDNATGVLTRTPEERAKRMREAYDVLVDVEMQPVGGSSGNSPV